MSSIVRKSQFTPKVKKTAVRRKNQIQPPVNVLTPPSTQHSDKPFPQQPAQQPETPQASQTAPSLSTPEPSQPLSSIPEGPPATPKFNFALNKEAADTPKQSEDIDPKDISSKLDTTTQPHQQPDYSDDTFKKPSDRLGSISSHRRRSSLKLQKRLSGITPQPPRTRTRSSSIISDDAEPIRIGIPNSRGAKRRKSSAVRGSVAEIEQPRTTAINVPSQPTPPPVEEPEKNVDALRLANEAEMEEQHDLMKIHADDKHENPKINETDEYVVGLDPDKKTLRKYRRRTEENANEVPTEDQLMDPNYVPVAPANLERRITGTKQIPKKIEKEDVKLYAQINIIPDEFSMADLCKPSFEIGTISENFDQAVNASTIIAERKAIRRIAREEARKKRIPFEEALMSLSNSDDSSRKPENKIDFDSTEEPKTSSGIQLKMVNGQMAVDTQSTFVARDPKLLDRSQEATEVNQFADPIISSSYTKRTHTEKWTSDELAEFYKALSTWGTDFSFIAQLFPYRTRKQIKSKFNSEEKKFPEIVSLALKRKLPSDFEKYCKKTKNKIETMEYYEEELRVLRLEHEQHIAEINEEKERAIQDDKEANRKREHEIRTGSKMTRAEKQREFRKNEQVIGSIDDVKKKREDD